jgi:hypothetical protein
VSDHWRQIAATEHPGSLHAREHFTIMVFSIMCEQTYQVQSEISPGNAQGAKIRNTGTSIDGVKADTVAAARDSISQSYS